MTIGGGTKKVLYTLATAQRIGLLDSAKALTSHNACKACGLGMGGQRGGMTNEAGEFPSVCNKSVQAQSTDIQAPIPGAVFEHSLAELRELTAHELEHLGRVAHPLHKAPGDDRFREIDWNAALARTAEAFAMTNPQRSFFYSSGRSSNEAGFVLQLLARALGTNNVSNCSYYCHQATGVALSGTVGTGTATVELADLDACDLVFLIGANPASNHPRLLHRLIELRRRGGHVVVINPLREPGLVRFAAPKMPTSLLLGGDDVASDYVQPRAGTDIALFTALARRILDLGAVDEAFVAGHTTGYEVLRAHLDAVDVDALARACGMDLPTIDALARRYARAERVVFAWGMGMTHHATGVANIEWISNLALLRGMIGRRHAGLLPLRGHSNVQGIGTIGVKPVLSADVLERMQSELGLRAPTTPGLDTLATLEAARDGAMDAALLMGGNLFDATPDTAFATEAFDRIGFRAHLTTTLNRGHVHGFGAEDREGEAIVLPVCARDEEPEPTTQESMFNYVRLSDGGIRRIATVRAESAVLAEIGAGLLPDGPVDFAAFRRHRTVREAIARIVPGLEALADIDVARREFHVRGRLLHTPRFATEDGRARFVVPDQVAGTPSADLPFTLVTLRSEGQFNSIIYEEGDSYRGVDDREVLFVNAEDAASLGITDGGRVQVRSEIGELRLRAKVFDLPRGTVAAYYPEANAIVPRTADARSRTPAFKSVPVSIAPATD